VAGNWIGIGADGETLLGNTFSGISLTSGSSWNLIGPENRISANGIGIFVNLDSILYNTFHRNMITRNNGPGINLANGGNMNVEAPVVSLADGERVAGHSVPGAIIEIFSDSGDEGRIFEGSTVADSLGNFQWMGPITGPSVTATATDTLGNTSPFSQPFLITGASGGYGSPTATRFVLQQNYPNLFNPSTEIRFTLASRERVTLQIISASGKTVITLVDGSRPPGRYAFLWDGRDAYGKKVPSGVYFCRIRAGIFAAVRKMILIR